VGDLSRRVDRFLICPTRGCKVHQVTTSTQDKCRQNTHAIRNVRDEELRLSILLREGV
jgi:hypothetical protein